MYSRKCIHNAACLLLLTPFFLLLSARKSDRVQALSVQPHSVTAAPTSDDFSKCTLNSGLWTFTNPAGDGNIRLTGQGVQLSVPATGDHNLWEENKDVLRLTQPVDNMDFAVEAVFESPVTQRFQTQGILVQQDENNLVRFDYFHDGATVRAFAATLANNVATVRRSTPITAPTEIDMLLAITRTGETWTAQYRAVDSNAWRVNVSFEHPIGVNTIGLFAGNVAPKEGEPPPTFTATVDYFFNSLTRITPEDANPPTLIVRTTGAGSGAVSASPPGPAYACDQPIQLVATPNEGSLFAGWSGAAAGQPSPATLTLAQGDVVTATFILGQVTPESYLPLVHR